MPEVDVHVVRWVADNPQPGIIECRLVDADGVEHVLIDKSAIACAHAKRTLFYWRHRVK